MSAPSKQECSFCRGSGVVHGEQCVACAGRGASTSELNRLVEENKRLREQARAAEWRVSLADENERLRAELARSDEECARLGCEAAGLAAGNERLRAERAECVGLLEEAAEVINTNYNLKLSTRQREADGWWKKWESHLCDDHDAYNCAKCSAKGQQP